MPFVLDASVASAWAFEDEDHPHAAIAFERIRTDAAVVPTLWWFELRNTLLMNERRGRLTEPITTDFLRRIARLSITVDSSPVEGAVLALSRKHRLTVYDAAYLELAQRIRVPIATLDGALVMAAQSEKVPLLDGRGG